MGQDIPMRLLSFINGCCWLRRNLRVVNLLPSQAWHCLLAFLFFFPSLLFRLLLPWPLPKGPLFIRHGFAPGLSVSRFNWCQKTANNPSSNPQSRDLVNKIFDPVVSLIGVALFSCTYHDFLWTLHQKLQSPTKRPYSDHFHCQSWPTIPNQKSAYLS